MEVTSATSTLQSIRIDWIYLGVFFSAVAIGFMVVSIPEFALALTLVLVGVLLLSAPAAYWAMGALVAAFTFSGLAAANALPSVATFVDIPLAWGALAGALLKRAVSKQPVSNSPRDRIYLRLFALLIGSLVASWVFNPSELLRLVTYVALLGQPFALIAALMLDRPTERQRRVLAGLLVSLLAVQVPIVAWQATTLGLGDPVQGTLFGAGSGTRVMALIGFTGSVWLFLRATAAGSPPIRRAQLLVAAPLFLIPYLADVRQILLALPVALLAVRWRRSTVRLLPVAIAIVGLVGVVSLGTRGAQTVGFFERFREGAGKSAAFGVVVGEIRSDMPSLFFGKGPAETVSRAGFMTTDLLLKEESPLRALGLHPASTAIEADTKARAGTGPGGGGSVNSGLSSAIGLLGDAGVVGSVSYLALYGYLFMSLRSRYSPEAWAAAAGWAVLAVFGITFDGWEQPPITVFLAVLSGLALIQARPRTGHRLGARAHDLNPSRTATSRASGR